MKSLLLLVSLIVFSLSSAFAQTASYPLTCVFDGTQDISIQPSMTQARKLTVSFSFKHATKPATQGVVPGTCAWQDRGLFADEPTIVIATVPEAFTYFEIRHRGMYQLVLTPSMALWAPRAKTPGYSITFNVYQSGPEDGTAVNFFKVVQ